MILVLEWSWFIVFSKVTGMKVSDSDFSLIPFQPNKNIASQLVSIIPYYFSDYGLLRYDIFMYVIPQNTSEPVRSCVWVNTLQLKTWSWSQQSASSHKWLFFNKLLTRMLHLTSKITGWINAKNFLIIFSVPKDSQQYLDFLFTCKDVPANVI